MSNTKKVTKKTNGGGEYKPRGDEEVLGYNVFDYGKHNQNQDNKTLETILSLIGRTYQQPSNTITLIRRLRKEMIPDVISPNYCKVHS